MRNSKKEEINMLQDINAFLQRYANPDFNTRPPSLNDEDKNSRLATTEMSPRIFSMLRFEVDENKLKQYRDEDNSSWPLLTLQDIKTLVERGALTCINADKISEFIASWNGTPLSNEQAEQELVKPKATSEQGVFALIPFSAFRDGINSQDKEPRFALLAVDNDVLSPVEPTSTRWWLNVLFKRYDFRNKTVAEVFSGSGPAAVVAKLGGATEVDAYDLMPAAVTTAQRNYDLHQISGDVLESNVFDSAEDRKYDFILANPPFNPKPTGTSRLDRLGEAVQDGKYQALEKFLRQLPEHLNEDGRAIVLYESSPYQIAPDMAQHDGEDAIKQYINQLNRLPNFPYTLMIEKEYKLRRARNNDESTVFVVYEISAKTKNSQ